MIRSKTSDWMFTDFILTKPLLEELRCKDFDIYILHGLIWFWFVAWGFYSPRISLRKNAKHLFLIIFFPSMDNSLSYWRGVYQQLKADAVCVDIERASFNGPISVIGWYEPKEGLIECNFFIKGQNLSAENLRSAFNKYKLFITYNGLYYDIPAIQKEFPGVFPKDIRVLDLYLFAKKLNLDTNLKVLENTLKVERSYEGTLKKGRTVRLWQRYEKFGDKKALMQLLEYNKQDVVNLYPLAEELTGMVHDV